MKVLLRSVVLASIGMIATVNSVQADDALTMQLQAYKVVMQNDQPTYVPVTTAPIGTAIQYKATYTNTLSQPMTNLAVTLPIPASMTFTGEAYPGSAQASLDGINYAEMPLMRKVDGKLVKVPYSEYRSLRWNIKYLPAKKTANVALNVKVNS